MRRHTLALVVLAGITLVAAVTFGPARPSRAGDKKKEEVKPIMLEPVEKSQHEFMEYLFEPAYVRLKAQMAKAEKDRAAWKAIKGDALVLAEGGNLLIMRPAEKGLGDWVKHSEAVREAGGRLYAAARKMDDKAAAAAYREMLQRCNACHKQFAEGKHQLEP